MNLEEIGKQEWTEKVGHGYLPIYEKLWAHLKDEPITLLEIGVYNGNSMRTWCRWFPNATIVGIDKNPNNPMRVDRAEIHIGDQADKDFLERVAGKYPKFDIIIDDGGHIWDEQQISFKHLWKSLKDGGMYIIEDLHTSREIWWGSPYGISTVSYLKELAANVVFDLTTDIAEISFYPSLAVIHKAL